MITEWLTWLLTPAPWWVRRVGYLAESVAIGARYRRCRAAWQPHLTACQETILAFSHHLPRRRTLVVLGSGAGYDLPVEALAADWQRIVLVDLVHPWSIRWRAARLPHVERVTWEIAGVRYSLLGRLAPGTPLPLPQPFWPLPDDCDALISLNVMSQLPVMPIAYLARRGWPEGVLAAWSRTVVAAHWQQLVEAGVPTLLITDVAAEWRTVLPGRIKAQQPGQTDTDLGRVGTEPTIEREETLFGFSLPVPPARTWHWTIAPAGELAAGVEKRLTVVAVLL